MEIERKWMVNGWPEKPLPLIKEHSMRQGYLSVEPTVRIREEALKDGKCSFILCLKSGSGIARNETEIEITKEIFDEIGDMIGMDLIPKVRRTYALPDGLALEVNHVDEGAPTEFWYAEVEFRSLEEARSWDPSSAGLGEYLCHDVSEEPGQTMGAYWVKTRINSEASH